MWATTVTLSLLSEHAASKYHNGMLAFGWSKNDHQQVFDRFIDEVSKLCSPKFYYCILTNSFRRVAFELSFYLADRPECDVQLSLLGHGIATSNLWSYRNQLQYHHAICVTKQGCGIAKVGNICINVTTGLVVTYMIIPKHRLCTTAWVSNYTDD